MSVAQAVWFALVAVLLFIVYKAAEVAISREYDGWGFALARFLIRLAGAMCPTWRSDWLADVLYIQRHEGRAGLYEAIWHLVAVLGPSLRATSTRIRSRRAALTQERRSFLLTEAGDYFLTEEGDRILLEDGDRGHVVGSGDVTVVIPTATLHASGVVRLTGNAELGPPPAG